VDGLKTSARSRPKPCAGCSELLQQPIGRRAHTADDGARVILGVASRARGEVRGDVERVLSAQLEPPFHHPGFVGIGHERRERTSGMTSRMLHRFIEAQEVPPDDSRVGPSRSHRPKRPLSIRTRWTASIFVSCGRKSQ
jgi:hypothetical protein